ncbi:MAG: hypothetical protein EBR90_03850 [Actinobacteria bacterium]|nr:hypothetical protein [Actinomycetota bacterium]
MVAVGSTPTPGTMNISKADLAKLDALLPKIGIDEATANMGGTVLGDAMVFVAQVIIDKLKESARKKDLKATNNLIQSISADYPSITPQGIEIEISMADYWERVEDGQKPGTWPHMPSLIQWVGAKASVKRIALERKGKNQTVQKAIESFASVVAKKIHSKGTIKRFGYKGSGFIAAVLTQQNVDTIAQKLSDLTGLRLTAYVTTEVTQ